VLFRRVGSKSLFVSVEPRIVQNIQTPTPYFALRPHTRELYPFFAISDFSISLSKSRTPIPASYHHSGGLIPEAHLTKHALKAPFAAERLQPGV
jgi:hypothetical protein